MHRSIPTCGVGEAWVVGNRPREGAARQKSQFSPRGMAQAEIGVIKLKKK